MLSWRAIRTARPGDVSGRVRSLAGAVSCEEVRLMRFKRITVDPGQMGGVPCIRGLRMPVATVVGMVADGMTVDEILKEHPTLETEDITEALQYAAEAVRERMIPL
jgi:uncharacterized protein (DUF433 family)